MPLYNAYHRVRAWGSENNAAGVTTVNTGASPSIDGTPVQNAGNANTVWVYYEAAASRTLSVVDTYGNTYTARGSEINSATSFMRAFTSIGILTNSPGTANTVTCNFTGGTVDFPAIYCREDEGIAAFLGAAGQAQTAPTTATDAVSTTDVNVTSLPAAQFALSMNSAGFATPAAGTGFAAHTAPSWDYGATELARAEDRQCIATGNQSATFTASNNSLHLSIQIVYTLATFPQERPRTWLRRTRYSH